MLNEVLKLRTADGSIWIPFNDSDNIVMETAYCNPNIRLLDRVVDQDGVIRSLGITKSYLVTFATAYHSE